jgi:heat-inducible transcriptional repressor
VLQPQVLMVVVITSTGGVTKRLFTFANPVDPGLADWAASYLNERLVGLGLGARVLQKRLHDPSLSRSESDFLDALAPAFTELEVGAHDNLYVEGTSRLFRDDRLGDVTDLNVLMDMLERRVTLLGVLRAALNERDVLVRIGAENEAPGLRSLALVAAGYGLPQRRLGTVSVIGPLRMDYGHAIHAVRDAAAQLSTFIADVYDER